MPTDRGVCVGVEAGVDGCWDCIEFEGLGDGVGKLGYVGVGVGVGALGAEYGRIKG